MISATKKYQKSLFFVLCARRCDDIKEQLPQWQRQSEIASQQRSTTHHISFTSNMKCLFSTMALLLISACNAFTSVPKSNHQQSVSSLLSMSSIPSESGDSYWSDEFEDDACWQNIYDDDCAMSTANLAFFKASTWVKGMPCAEGIEVC